MKDLYLWLRVDDNVTEKDIIKNLSEKGVTYCIHPLPDFDWSSFRREAAKDAMCQLIGMGRDDGYKYSPEQVARYAIVYADELINQLRDGKE